MTRKRPGTCRNVQTSASVPSFLLRLGSGACPWAEDPPSPSVAASLGPFPLVRSHPRAGTFHRIQHHHVKLS
eukprot:scaffold803_cov310-Pinguiococcus_pyrenoidosus.AAC.208